MRKFLTASALGMATLLSAAVASAQVYVRVGPPRPVYERPGPPRPGYAWQGGYHRWDGNRYVWTPGTYVAETHPGARWVPGHWRNTPRGWIWDEGHWR